MNKLLAVLLLLELLSCLVCFVISVIVDNIHIIQIVIQLKHLHEHYYIKCREIEGGFRE